MAINSASHFDSATKQICPFWLDADQSCSLYKQGLFLPGAEHVRLFCRHDNYHSCGHYIDSMQLGNTDSTRTGRLDKRRSRRLPARFPLHLAEPAFDGLERVLDDTALTVDISEVGLRFETRTPMQVGAFVEFSLWHEARIPLCLKGTGRITWCHSLENAPLYHAGISFTDDTVALDISNQLVLS